MLTIRTCGFVTLTLAMTVSGLAPHARAQANCETYGKLALQQQKENEALKCGFSGLAWSPDLKAHIAWCTGVGPDQWRDELAKRKQQLDTCKAR